MTKTASSTEVEAKFEVPDAATYVALSSLDRLGPYRLQPRGEQRVTDRYLDTPGRDLLRGGYACRKREAAGSAGAVVAIKGLGGARGAVHRREEHEMSVADWAEPSDWPTGRCRDIVLRLAGDRPLVELFALRQQRVLRDVRRSGRRVAVLSLDRVEIDAGNPNLTHELEIELTPFGTLADLRALAKHLQPFRLYEQPLSKFERALALAGGAGSDVARPESAATTRRRGAHRNGRGTTKPSPAAKSSRLDRLAHASESHPTLRSGIEHPLEVDVPAPPTAATVTHRRSTKKKATGIAAGDTMAEAGRKILRFHYDRMLAKEDGTRSGHDPEDLHDMRVATRRQRAALRLVEPHFRRKAVRPIRDGLRALGRCLGTLRDLDVLLEAAVHYGERLDQQAMQAFQLLLDRWKLRRETARAAMLAHLDGVAYAAFKQEYAKFLDTAGAGVRPPPTGGEPRPSIVAHVLPGELLDHYGAVRAFGPSLPWASVETLHALRIEAKRLRYALEFFREVLCPESEQAVRTIVVLQDHLGELQDAAVTIALVREFLAGPEAAAHPAAAAAAGRYLESRAARLAELRSSVGGPWKGVEGTEFRSILARAVAAL